MSEYVFSNYQRYGLEIRDDGVTVYTPTGRKIGEASSVKKARAIVRGYRRAERADAYTT